MIKELLETMWTYCPTCEEEYDLPEDCMQCPICGSDIEEV